MAIFVDCFWYSDIDASEQHPGMIWHIAFESVIKLAALLILGFGWSARCTSTPADIFRAGATAISAARSFIALLFRCPFILQCVLAGLLLLCLLQSGCRYWKTIKPNTFKQHAGYFRFILIFNGDFVSPLPAASFFAGF